MQSSPTTAKRPAPSPGQSKIELYTLVQDGVISRSQALEELTEGQLRWKLKRGTWQILYPGVYLTHGSKPSWNSLTHAALLHCGETAALSGLTAAHLHEFERDEPRVVHVSVPWGLHPSVECLSEVFPVLDLQISRRRRIETTRMKGRRVTTAAFTVVDLANEKHASREDAIAVAARAVQRRRVSAPEIAAELAARRAHRHREALELSLGAVAEGAESGLEVEYLERVIRAHGLPPMQMAVPDRLVGSRIRRDFENATFGVVSEVDGKLGHEAEGRRKDARRDRKTLATGRVTARQTWSDVRFQPCELAADLFCIFRSRGYRGLPTLCSMNCQITRHIAEIDGRR